MRHFSAICRVKMAMLLSASYLLIGGLKGERITASLPTVYPGTQKHRLSACSFLPPMRGFGADLRGSPNGKARFIA
jgi:hypothetical protein